jgi:hypothetical protein
MGRRTLLVISAALIFAGIACTGNDEALKIVRAYNDAVIMAYRTGDTGRLPAVAGEREARVIGVLIATKRSAGLVLESSLEHLDVVRFDKTSPGAALVETRERWRYYDRPLKPGGAAGQIIQAEMKVQYTCERTGSVWRVMNVKVLDNAFLDRKEPDKKS